MHHVHSPFLIWLFFFGGQAFYLLGRAWGAKQSKLNGIMSIRGYFLVQGPQLLIRVPLLASGFGLWITAPSPFMEAIVRHVPAVVGEFLGVIPVNPFVALLVGLAGEWVVGLVARRLHLEKEIPPLDVTGVPTEPAPKE